MDKKEMFKEFVKKNPALLKYVKNNEMTWQKFYEMYDLYGEEESTWNPYLRKETVETVKTAATGVGLADALSWLKNIDLNSVQEGVNSVQRVLGVLGDFTKKDTPKKEDYKARPLYKHFED